MRLWDDQGNLVRTWEGPTPRGISWEDAIWSLAISPDGKQVVAGQALGKILRYEIETGRELPPLAQGNGLVLAVAFGPKGELATASGQLIQLWAASTGQPIRQINAGFDLQVNSLAFNHDGTRLACGTGGDEWVTSPGGVAVWETLTGRNLFSIPVPHDGVRGVAFSPDGKRLSAVSNDGFLVVWHAEEGQEVRSIQAHAFRAWALAYSPDGSRLLTSGDDAITIWDTRDWMPLLSAATPSALCLATDPLGQRVAAGLFEPAVSVLDARPLPAERLLELDAQAKNRELAIQRRIQAQGDAQRLPIFLHRGQWAEAAEVLSRDIARSPGDLNLRYHHVLSLLAAGDLGGYHRAALELLESTRDKVDPFALNNIEWFCLLGPEEASHFDEPLRLRRGGTGGLSRRSETLDLEHAGSGSLSFGALCGGYQDSRRGHQVAQGAERSPGLGLSGDGSPSPGQS